jgi:PPK2 family polyphosphate:nucleotide phosphotransferase
MKRAIDSKDFVVKQGDKVDLSDWPTLAKPVYRSKEEYHAQLAEQVERLSDLQEKLYAHNSDSLLLIFQAMDAAGKDGAIRHIMSGVNPQGCRVTSFKHPSGVELEHDFLWRVTRELPERGMIGIFNRSYYESVLILRVHPKLLIAEGFDPQKADGDFWRDRYRSIVDLERHLTSNHVHVLKFFLHISKEEQRKRLLARIDEPEKNWKISQDDIVERGFWDDYQKAYEKCLSKTSSTDSPWFVVPADDKLSTRLIVSHIILEKLESLKLAFPSVDEERRKELQSIRASLTA